ncbi:carboxypeptidase-like regulatory domain-containing protein [uncultured Pontibacter sp.]|uniref:carboxypeptidase-like regulatory domain-containing protein n=1 Tax=uncultured Pontibacter sp. TaxID=453356 RepID=UPI00260D998F|nr:carboxypeptidase-like regulatory domain-containing protein [uncultured Pontibacter sp.]
MKTLLKLQFYTCLMLLAAAFSACDYDENDYISKYCPGSCTVIKGRVSTENGAPLPGATIRVRWLKEAYLQPTFTREKAIATTDANGNYELRFLLRDQELTEGFIELNTDFDQRSYLTCNGSSTWYWYAMARDTAIIQNFTIAPAATLRLVIDQNNPTAPVGRILTTVKYKISSSDADSCAFVYDTNSRNLSGDQLTVAAGSVVVHTVKTYGGTQSARKDTILLKPGETRNYEINF